ncbi:Lrp/AsnC family transcriptional regulator [Sphingopyxis sp. OPL5]|uniref:Lrp/AsnC family transcriptional regulator n=1 Tax=unclassified Sphingopyxis TaxID=2614943 RepID=UPI00164E8155|nr:MULTISPECIES: Lrp/AsnC family transcriptional regulator [unclassified Sphingopyxis]QNO25605.1 Lrp/AsnC family transcriptional regulator [Sphingopyxis sp. OPL5]HJS11542.1 Lrp/AsnC family transcriptional regulator [Sphingopyxis sp.]
MTRVSLDDADVRILGILQEDATLSIAAVAAKANMSQNACWRRIKRLEESGVIARRVTILDASALGLDLTVFVSLRASEHSEAWLDTLNSAIRDIPEVVEFYRMTGDVDYLLKLRVENMAAYDAVYRRIIRSIRLTDVSSAFSMEEIKFTTALPLTARPS